MPTYQPNAAQSLLSSSTKWGLCATNAKPVSIHADSYSTAQLYLKDHHIALASAKNVLISFRLFEGLVHIFIKNIQIKLTQNYTQQVALASAKNVLISFRLFEGLVHIFIKNIQIKLTQNYTQQTHTGTRNSGGKRLSKVNNITLLKPSYREPRVSLYNPFLFIVLPTENTFCIDDIGNWFLRRLKR